MSVSVFLKCGGALSLILSLAACGGGSGDGGDAPDPLASYRSQVLDWAACDPNILSGALVPQLEKLGPRARCAMMRVPMDYDNPGRADLQIALLRVSASEPGQRRGAMLLNPGGPGENGLGLAPYLAALFQLGAPGTALGDAFLQLDREYDLIGFSPRGTGASSRQFCGSTELVRQVDFSRDGAQQQNIDNVLYNARILAEACERNPVTPYLNTATTAQDMDMVRSILGDDKLHYLGFSYGTWLGGWYARRFPDRAGRIVLDSAIDLTQPLDNMLLLQPGARQRILDAYVAPYLASRPDLFNLGTSVVAIRALLPDLSTDVQRLLYAPLSGLFYKRSQINDMGVLLGGARGLDQVLAQYPDADADDIVAVLSRHDFVPGNEEFNAQMRQVALSLFERLRTPFSFVPVEAQGSGSVFWSVVCNDSLQRGQQFWTDFALQGVVTTPVTGMSYLDNACMFWNGPRVSPPALDVIAQHELLVVQSEFDGATAVEGARATFNALPKASLLYVPDEYTHGMFASGNDCVNEAVARYLTGESPARRETSCAPYPAREATGDPTPAPTEKDARDTQASTAEQSNPNYTDPEYARQLQERISDMVGTPRR